VELAFYGGNFTGLPVDVQEALLAHAATYIGRKDRQPSTGGSIPASDGEAPNRQPLTGIRVSTRPDHLDTDTIKRLKGYGVTTVEIGAQTMVPEILESLQRDHTPDDTVRAVKRLHEAGIAAGVHLMTGLPGELPGQAVFSARRVAEMKPDHVRIHPLVVLEGSPLARLWRQGRFRPLSLTAAVRRVAGMVRVFQQHGIPVARMGLHPPDGGWGKRLLAGPWHPAFSELVHSFLFRRLIGQGIRESQPVIRRSNNVIPRLDNPPTLEQEAWKAEGNRRSQSVVEIHINPRDMSRAIGYRRSNARFFKRVLGPEPEFKPDESVTAGTVTIKQR